LQQLPAAIPGEVVDELALASATPSPRPSCVGSCNIQPAKVAVGVQGGWIEATIGDRATPAPHTAPLTSHCGRGGG
jgi:hypothetical protein